MLYRAHDLTLTDFENAALLVGCGLISVAYPRNGFAEIDVYPSHSFLHGTITVILAGIYLLALRPTRSVFYVSWGSRKL